MSPPVLLLLRPVKLTTCSLQCLSYLCRWLGSPRLLLLALEPVLLCALLCGLAFNAADAADLSRKRTLTEDCGAMVGTDGGDIFAEMREGECVPSPSLLGTGGAVSSGGMPALVRDAAIAASAARATALASANFTRCACASSRCRCARATSRAR